MLRELPSAVTGLNSQMLASGKVGLVGPGWGCCSPGRSNHLPFPPCLSGQFQKQKDPLSTTPGACGPRAALLLYLPISATHGPVPDAGAEVTIRSLGALKYHLCPDGDQIFSPDLIPERQM